MSVPNIRTDGDMMMSQPKQQQQSVKVGPQEVVAKLGISQSHVGTRAPQHGHMGASAKMAALPPWLAPIVAQEVQSLSTQYGPQVVQFLEQELPALLGRAVTAAVNQANQYFQFVPVNPAPVPPPVPGTPTGVPDPDAVPSGGDGSSAPPPPGGGGQ